ncbi:MAG: hypothetical protein IK008_06315 [Bacteroidales bacterium]|nr:hypothetical protein [Bacteroidales bacterium]
MRFSTIAAGAALFSLVTLAACKKDDADSTLPSLSGMELNDFAAYLATGTNLELQADVRNVVGPDGEKPTVYVCWQLNSEAKDTVKTDDGSILYIDLSDKNLEAKWESQYKEKLKRTLSLSEDGEYTLYCYAYASGYYGTSDYIYVNAVTPETVVTGAMGLNPVQFGEQSYWTVTRNGKKWTANNLYDPSAGLSFRQCEVLDRGMGRLYNWTEAQSLCPAGWHLPTVAEFQTAFGDANGDIPAGDLIVDALFQKREMWTYNADVQFTNATGFAALPAGYVDTNDPFNTWDHYGHYAFFWTADQNADLGTYLYLYEKEPLVRKAHGDKNTLYMSVRCVED